ncbi:phage tail protein I [Oricola sp.]|uniref:phage tail protein I n=1 Tax=Oricola sp. TaxID=1979950 RepID=UPI0025FA5611|nr:phage tail protein I [Oricola sp.]MCI5078709.1 phage tail protein I [Oricola sp.]
MARETVLPDNRGAFEEAADLTGARIGELPVDLRDLVRPFEVAPAHLPWLAWGLSVDLWDKGWPQEKKRARTARSLPFHAIKGTQTAIAETLAVMGAEARRFIVPPARTFMSKAFSDEERSAYLDRFAQLRIYPFVQRGVTGRFGLFLGQNRGAGEACLGPVNPVSAVASRYLRTGTVYDRGEERSITVRTVTPEDVGSCEAVEYDEAVIAAKPTKAVHLGAGYAGAAHLIDDAGVRQRIVRIPRAVYYSYRLGREQYTTHMPDGGLVDVRPQFVAEEHAAQVGSVFPGGDRQRIVGGHLPPSIAWQHVYERWHIHDPARVIEERRRSTHIGHTRLGMPAYHAEVLTRIKGRRWPRTAGRHVNGFFVAASRRPIEDARAAVNASKALRDKVLINTTTYRLPRVGDRLPVGSIDIGAYIEV